MSRVLVMGFVPCDRLGLLLCSRFSAAELVLAIGLLIFLPVLRWMETWQEASAWRSPTKEFQDGSYIFCDCSTAGCSSNLLSSLLLSRPVQMRNYLLWLCKENSGFINLPCSVMSETWQSCHCSGCIRGRKQSRKNAKQSLKISS